MDDPKANNDQPFHNPFGALRHLAGGSTAAGAESVTEAAAAPASSEVSKPIPRAIVRLERSGRRGKEVTVVEHLAIAAAARDEWLKALKAALGCGGSVEDDRLVLQGDQRSRLPALLQARGVKRVTLG